MKSSSLPAFLLLLPFLTLTTAQLQCAPSVSRFSSRTTGSTQNCAKALASSFLPTSSNDPLAPGEFHYYAPDNDFRLPRSSIEGDCEVVVDLLAGALPVEGSWTDVFAMANTMMTACASTKDLTVWYTGGFMQVGTGRGLRVTMRKAPNAAPAGTAEV